MPDSAKSTSLPGSFDEEAFHAHKRRERNHAWIFGALGAFVLLDSGLPYPIPLIGLPSVLLGGVLLAYGFFQYRAYHRPPLHEALELGRSLGGSLTRTELFLRLRLNAEETDELLQELIGQGFLEQMHDDVRAEQEPRFRLLS